MAWSANDLLARVNYAVNVAPKLNVEAYHNSTLLDYENTVNFMVSAGPGELAVNSTLTFHNVGNVNASVLVVFDVPSGWAAGYSRNAEACLVNGWLNGTVSVFVAEFAPPATYQIGMNITVSEIA
jgi:hypothetical protein